MAHFIFYFRLIVHDGFHDVLGWNNPEGLSVNTDLVHYVENKPGCHSNHSVAIVIDSLSPMMLHRSAPYTCEVISKLSRSKIHSKYAYDYIEPRHEKTNILVSDLVRHKPVCTATEDG